ncbi:hypothetical protein [Helicobacter sp. 23-1045]
MFVSLFISDFIILRRLLKRRIYILWIYFRFCEVEIFAESSVDSAIFGRDEDYLDEIIFCPPLFAIKSKMLWMIKSNSSLPSAG